MADLVERLQTVIADQAVDALCKEAAGEITRLQNSLADYRKLAIAAYAVGIYAVPHSDGTDVLILPRVQFNDLTAALARVGVFN